MERRQFIERLLIGSGSALILSSTLTSCEKEDNSPSGNNTPVPSGGIRIDLSEQKNSSLLNTGGFIYISGIIVANAGSDEFLAVASACTHLGCTVNFTAQDKKFLCPCHYSEFSVTGSVLKGPATVPLKRYTVTKEGNILTIK
jgi:cytochrome b6-f complex iron-sulfur subunit